MNTENFKHQRNGYNRTEVDAFLEDLSKNSQIEIPEFSTKFHGYNREEVDRFLDTTIKNRKIN